VRLSISFTGFGGIAGTFPAVLAAEEAGLDGVWSAEHIGFHDAIVPSAVILVNVPGEQPDVIRQLAKARH